MKKIRLILFVLISVLLTMCCSATTDDLFYYDFSNSKLNSCIEMDKKQVHNLDLILLKHYYLPEGETPDKSKFVKDLDHIFCDYLWTAKDIVDFLDAKDKKSFMSSFPITSCYFNVYYNNEVLPYMQGFFYSNDSQSFKNSGGGTVGRPEYSTLANKEELIKALAQEHLQEYTPKMSINLEGLWFVYAEKDDTDFLIYMPTADDDMDHYNEMTVDYKQLLDGRVLSVDQAKTFFTEFQRRYEIAAAEYQANPLIGGDSTHVATEGSVVSPWLWVGIGGGAVALALIVLIIVLAVKKKKA